MAKKMSNSPPPACPSNAINAQWLFPQEQAPSPPHDEDCKHNGFGDPALPLSNSSPPTPSLPMAMSRCILPSQLTTAVVKTTTTSTLQTTFSPGSLFGFSPHKDHSAAVRHLDVMISLGSFTVTSFKWLLESTIRDQLPDVVDRQAAMQKALDCVRLYEARQSRHQAVLYLEHDKVTCKQLRHLHLHWYVVATLKASSVTIRQCKAACAKALITIGINATIRRICAEPDLCAAPLGAILAEIKHCEIIHDDSSRRMSPACLPRCLIK